MSFPTAPQGVVAPAIRSLSGKGARIGPEVFLGPPRDGLVEYGRWIEYKVLPGVTGYESPVTRYKSIYQRKRLVFCSKLCSVCQYRVNKLRSRPYLMIG